MSGERVAVITAIYDGYDTVKPPVVQAGVDVDWVLVTDDPALAPELHGWRVVHAPRPGEHPNLAAKVPKMLPWEFTEAKRSIWIDASFRVLSEDFVTGALAVAEAGCHIAQFGHPARDCIYDEMAASSSLPKYAGQRVQEQVESYRAQGHPARWGLWATGVIVRSSHNAHVRAFGQRWLKECREWTFQDQLSEAFVLREVLNQRPELLPGSHWSNPWLHYEGSGRHHTG